MSNIISRSLREARQERGLLIREAAAELNLDQGLLSKIENGNRVPTEHQLCEFASFYHLNIEKLRIYRYSEKILRILQESSENAKEILNVVHMSLEGELSSETEQEELSEKTWLDEMLDKY